MKSGRLESAMANRGVKGDVLIVDDERWLCEIVGEVLEAEGYRPTIFTNPCEAIDAIERRSFELAFIDINMPEMSGLELASRIRGCDPHCEVVIMTGFASIENAIQAVKIGASDYLRKPFSTGEIGLCLRYFKERKALGERVSRAEERYFRLVQSIPMLIFRLRKDFELDFINQACLSILGYSQQEAMLPGGWLIDRIYSEDRTRIRDLLQSAFDSNSPSVTEECRLAHKDGHIVYGLLKCISYTGCKAEEDVDCIEGIIVDITDRVMLEKTLVQREKLKTLGVVAAEVAHEIRNPLVCIGGFARRLQKRLPDAPETRIIQRESERLEKILDRIRDYLTPVEICPRECSVNTVVTQCVELFLPHLQGKNIICRVDMNENMPPVLTDPDILAQVCINLMRNGLSATESGQELVIRTFETDRNIHIDFKNPATGASLKKPELLFLPFDEGGESIGLPLCYQLLKDMGGLLSFRLENDHVIFTISVPKTAQNRMRESGSWPTSSAETDETDP
jgi:two-component system, NtrC family, sensor histidine kinase HydH